MFANEKLQCISTEDYFYFTENFELVDSHSANKLVRFLVYNKRQRLIDTVRKVMTDELTSRECNIAVDYWHNRMTVEAITEKYGMSRSSFYRAITVIKKKLEASLKYVLFYNDVSSPPSKEDFFTQMKRATTDFMGEQIEN